MSYHGGTQTSRRLSAPIAYRDPLTSRAMSGALCDDTSLGVFPRIGDITSLTAKAAAAGSASHSSAGSALAAGASTGAAIGSVVPVVGTAVGGAIGAAIGVLSTIFGGGTADQAKAIWSQIPANVIRVQGGHGTWQDLVTGQTLTDAGTDIRKGAVMASALQMYNDQRNWWFDAATGQHVDPGTAAGRWNALFGAGTSFLSAYQAHPQLFRTFGDDPSQDPYIPAQGGSSTGSAPFGGATTPSPTNIFHPLTPNPGRLPVSMAGVAGVSPTVLLVAGGVLLAVLVAGKRRA